MQIETGNFQLSFAVFEYNLIRTGQTCEDLQVAASDW